MILNSIDPHVFPAPFHKDLPAADINFGELFFLPFISSFFLTLISSVPFFLSLVMLKGKGLKVVAGQLLHQFHMVQKTGLDLFNGQSWNVDLMITGALNEMKLLDEYHSVKHRVEG